MALLRNDPSARVPSPMRSLTAVTDPDAGLVAKLRRWVELSDLNCELSDRADELFLAAYDALPVPLALRIKNDNHAASVCRHDLMNRRNHLRDMIARVAELGKGAHGKAVTVYSREITEIGDKLTLLDAYEAQILAERMSNGHKAAHDEYTQSGHGMARLETEIAATPAAGYLGMLVKLGLANQFACFVTDEGADGDGDLRLVAGVARDIERLAGVTMAQLLGQ